MQYDVTVVGTAATVSVLHVENMPECGKSTPVFGDDLLSYSHGGMGLNICAGLAKLGLRVYPVLTYADDRQREFIHFFAKENAMPEDGLHDPPVGATGTTIIIQDGNKNHMTLITGYENRLPGSTYYGTQEMKPRFFENSKIAVFTAPMPANTAPAIDALETSGIPVALSMRKDPNALPPKQLWRLLKITSILFANEGEISYIEQEFKLKSICDLFQNENLEIIVQTLGAEGSRIYQKTEKEIAMIQVPCVKPHTDEVETVGAGDGYVCGFLYGYLRGRDIRQCAMLAGTVSSFVLEKEGSITNLPSEEQMLERYAAATKLGE